MPKKIVNLLVAGRCHSATAKAASSTRVTVTAMAMGQAAGTAAALALEAKTTPAELSGVKVRRTLEAQAIRYCYVVYWFSYIYYVHLSLKTRHSIQNSAQMLKTRRRRWKQAHI